MEKSKKAMNPYVFTKKTSFMQRVADLVRSGHHRYIMGHISIEKAGFFSAKMGSLYACNADKVTAHRMRKAGYCSSRLLFLYQEGQPQLLWILLVSSGGWQHDEAGREKWRDALSDRVHVTGYELVRHIRSGNARPSWTWRYTTERYAEVRSAIIQTIRRKRDNELSQWIDTVWRSPAFAGVREQVKRIATMLKSEWKRSRGSEIMPKIPVGIGYVRRIPDKGVMLIELFKELKSMK